MIFKSKEGRLADLRVLAAPVTTVDPIPIAIPEPSGSDAVFFDTELTHMGCRQRCRDMSGLSQCLCGERVEPDDVGSI